ncbi:MAG: hypothetical protein LBG21_06500 [Campylobacteraceae bacterium]|jgi:hypothetical protein|nr:hypothetical protein [Campylobacteraceae bacterium]
MKVIKTAAIISLITMLSAVNANAWGKKEQGILIGVGAALLLPSLLAGKNTHYTQQPIQYIQPSQPVQYIKPPQTTHIVKAQKYNFPHHKPKNHSYVNRKDYGSETIIIEHADGSRTIIEK